MTNWPGYPFSFHTYYFVVQTGMILMNAIIQILYKSNSVKSTLLNHLYYWREMVEGINFGVLFNSVLQ